jgi:hypothetical protein
VIGAALEPPPPILAMAEASVPTRPWSVVRVGAARQCELRVPRQAPGSPAATPAPRGSEWQVGVGHAWSFDLLQSKGDRRYVPVTVSWGRDLIQDVGPGLLRGRLLWGVELMPLYWQTAPTSTIGIAVSPLVWRWRFVPRRTAAPFAELAFGGLLTADPVPEATESTNFLTHGAIGIRWQPARRVALVTAYRFQHISNGNQLVTNPGVNAHVVQIGLSVVR